MVKKIINDFKWLLNDNYNCIPATRVLTSMMNDLNNSNNLLPLLNKSSIKTGDIVAVQSVFDGKWYRGKITNRSSSESITVLYIDYGNVVRKFCLMLNFCARVKTYPLQLT